MGIIEIIAPFVLALIVTIVFNKANFNFALLKDLTCFKNRSDNLTLFINPHTYPLEFAPSYIQ